MPLKTTKNINHYLDLCLKCGACTKFCPSGIDIVDVNLLAKSECIKNSFESDIMKGLDRALGFLFGLVEGVVIVCFVLTLLYAQPWFNVDNLLQDSFFHNFLGKFLAAPADSIRSKVINV